jgi:hypothetical protein
MKKISLFLFAIMLGTLSVIASGKPALNIIPLTAERILVAMQNDVTAPMEVRVTDDNGRLVFYKSVRRPDREYKKIYDLSALENGQYNVIFNMNNVRAERSIEINDDKIMVSDLRHGYDPSFIFDNKQLKFTYLNFDQEDFSFILYRRGFEVFRSSIGNDFALTKGFDLSQLDRGDYEAVIASGNKQYFHNIRID